VSSSIALIDEARCIGCTKCIAACPVDAIFGASKFMHTVIADECIGCTLCVPACPVDCISMVPMEISLTKEQRRQQAQHTRQRVQARKLRLQRQSQTEFASAAIDKKAALKAMLERVKNKK
jgi:electron transport complex protein RnfB